MTTTSGTRASTPTSRSDRTQEGSRRPRDASGAEEFERLLRDKLGLHDETEQQQAGGQMPAPELPLDRMGTLAMPAAAGKLPVATIQGVAASTHAAMEALSTAQAHALAATPPTTPDAACAFEVTLSEPMGVSLAMRATRDAAATASHEPARWTLSIASSSLTAAQLRRHVPRLDERLRAREVDSEPVDVQGREEKPR